ncbi:SulA-like leucine-rich domain-containing protein [Amphritea sp. 1_MG-2023]|uniref:cell division inhibitor SulA n=1 Tax=Amphritea sp. 1_MG-2023 TaxID=3062670 RepID=UPI0026E4486D|nr:SulA-like leucine-rich domain-containing protein [Amphritea sp. 1_MG-2023]MDO6563467.1 SulA-like leucine-rich domain-containing protein [Amphritea sp. 1_MG-2023]
MLHAVSGLNSSIPVLPGLIRPAAAPSTHPALAGKVTEIVLQGSDLGQMTMLLPLLAQLSKDDRWFAWIAPPASLPKNLLEAAGIDLKKVMLLQPDQNHSTYQLACQALKAGTCHAVISWPGILSNEELTGLEDAALNGQSHGIVIRDRRLT